jgi:hypothetical protein
MQVFATAKNFPQNSFCIGNFKNHPISTSGAHKQNGQPRRIYGRLPGRLEAQWSLAGGLSGGSSVGRAGSVGVQPGRSGGSSAR